MTPTEAKADLPSSGGSFPVWAQWLLTALLVVAILIVVLVIVILAKRFKKARRRKAEACLPRVRIIVDHGQAKCSNYDALYSVGSAANNSMFRKEFENMQYISEANTENEGLKCTVCFEPENFMKNRYVNAVPYDIRRILLKKQPNELQDYINASPIYRITMPSKGPVEINFGQMDYICAQAPMENTCGDFWRMIVENNVGVIVMLNKITDNVTPNCARYWPNRMHDRILYQSGSMKFQVKWTDRNSQPTFDERDFSVNRDGHGIRKHHVRQLAFANWPDQGVPNMEEFSAMLNEYKELKAASKSGSHTLVHCKTGIGRSGTFIVADILRRHLEKKCKVIDLPGVILQLRRCRPGMIRSPEQYFFLQEFANNLASQNG